MSASTAAVPRYLQLLWGVEPTTRRGPKPALTIWDIGSAGVAIADGQGWDAVSMKSVAGALGVTTMSLYRYVDSREELQHVMLDIAYGEADPAWTSTGPWRTRLDRWAREVAAALVRRPWVVMVPMNDAPVTPNVLTWTESGLRAFEDVELRAQDKLSALLLVDGFIRNHVRQSVQLGAVDTRGTVTEDDGTYEATIARLADPKRYPLLLDTVTAQPATGGSYYADELDFGLGVLFDGLEKRFN
ncbi:MAG: TetR family transcriptional regulator [Gordonia sp.]|uniref:TetR/AcrR family transcriptional regulator n=1 Tax=Williamsia sp. 1138 TaxID=1903117 RepID=UPI000A103EE2|nr:TetR/AcrR family transcriptional regulator C-terminal domain-containing protein [Williamsia sp. 1138]MBA4021329.1 TetR family transcriptional regulator [Gordonia sp. (in: high G+C Gram-positive bacteria)]OZG27524.1 TetR family transcriptional regulator [Williamsia sp. 1138]